MKSNERKAFDPKQKYSYHVLNARLSLSIYVLISIFSIDHNSVSVSFSLVADVKVLLTEFNRKQNEVRFRIRESIFLYFAHPRGKFFDAISCVSTSSSQCFRLRHTQREWSSHGSAPHRIMLRKVLCVAMSLQFRHRRLLKKPFFKWCHRLKIFLNHQPTILRVWYYVRTFPNHSIWIRTSTAPLSVCVWPERARETCFYTENGIDRCQYQVTGFTVQHMPALLAFSASPYYTYRLHQNQQHRQHRNQYV